MRMETALAKKTGEPDVAPGRVEGGADLGARVAKVKGETSNLEHRTSNFECGQAGAAD